VAPEPAEEPDEAEETVAAPTAPSPEPKVKPVADPPAEEVIEGEVTSEESAPPQTLSAQGQNLCGVASPYGDDKTCELVARHMGLHRADHGKSSWPR
jgi:hypothetical protein